MPLLVERHRYAAWLDPAGQSLRDLERLLVPAAPGRLEAYPVGLEVGDVRSNGPQLTQPVPFDLSEVAESSTPVPGEANSATLF
jgi:putative SOS response-associated peptidase YedK